MLRVLRPKREGSAGVNADDNARQQHVATRKKAEVVCRVDEGDSLRGFPWQGVRIGEE